MRYTVNQKTKIHLNVKLVTKMQEVMMIKPPLILVPRAETTNSKDLNDSRGEGVNKPLIKI